MELAELDKLMEEFEKLKRQKDAAESFAKEYAEQLKSLERDILEAFIASGVQSHKTSRGVTFFQKTATFFSPKPSVGVNGEVIKDAYGVTVTLRRELTEALANHCDFQDLVSPNYNANSLSARLREYIRNNGSLPPEIEKLVNITETPQLGVTGTGQKKAPRETGD